MKNLNPDEISRIALIALRNGSARTLAEAERQISERSIDIVATTGITTQPTWQAAVVTAAALAVRSFGRVRVLTDARAQRLVAGPFRGKTLGAVLGEIGVVEDGDGAGAVVVVVGNASVVDHAIYTSWRGWVAEASPTPSLADDRVGSNVVAAIASAALAVSEAFHYLVDEPGSNAGYRTVSLDLWGEGGEYAPFSYAPSGWWLAGLGHLGQAYGWIISYLPYPSSSVIDVILQDTDITSHANHSTSILTPPHSSIAKTRLVSASLDQAGLRSRIVERRMSSKTLPELEEVGHVALIGVDNLPTRRLISLMGWARAIDAGLGDSEQNYGAISLHSFPSDQLSSAVAAWQGTPREVSELPSVPGFEDLGARFEECGVIELAGKAVGVPFVGMVAGALAVSMAVREIEGGGALGVRRFDLKTLDKATAKTNHDRQLDIDSTALLDRAGE